VDGYIIFSIFQLDSLERYGKFMTDLREESIDEIGDCIGRVKDETFSIEGLRKLQEFGVVFRRLSVLEGSVSNIKRIEQECKELLIPTIELDFYSKDSNKKILLRIHCGDFR